MSLDPKTKTAFLMLMLVQAAHSLEEVKFELWSYLEQARWVGTLFSNDVATGFATGNALVVGFGFWCYFARVRPSHTGALLWIYPWAIVELVNGITHPLMALYQGRYVPGTYTAPLLFAAAVYLLFSLRRPKSGSSH